MEACVGLSGARAAKLIRVRCDDRAVTSVFKVQPQGGHILRPTTDTNLDETVQSHTLLPEHRRHLAAGGYTEEHQIISGASDVPGKLFEDIHHQMGGICHTSAIKKSLASL